MSTACSRRRSKRPRTWRTSSSGSRSSTPRSSALPMSPITRSVIALILAAAAWGLGTVISKRAVAEMPPLTWLAIQVAASVVVLVLLMRWRRVPLRDPSAPPVLGRMGMLNPGLAYALSLLGLTHISASLSVLLWALEPILILVLAAWFLSERVSRTVLALSGVAV